MQNKKNKLVVRKDDYEILVGYLRNGHHKYKFDRQNAEELSGELKKAKVFTKEKFPSNVVRLNSRVLIREEESGKLMEFILVTPDKANIKENKISVLAPIGTALIGFREGHIVKWNVPSGKKSFAIMEVHNDRA